MSSLVLFNGAAALINLAMYAYTGNPINLACVCFSGSLALAFYLFPMVSV